MSARSGPGRGRIALVAFGVVVALALVWAGATSSAAHDPYNPGGDGTSEFRQQVDAEPGLGYETAAGYDALDPEGTVAVVTVADEEGDVTDTGGAEAFVREGGTLVVLADDSGANELLESVGAESRIDGQVLRDDRHHHRGPAMPIATEIEPHALTGGVDRLGLTHATAVEPNGAAVLARTSESAYLVDHPAATLDEDERPASRPVATVEAVGSGTVIVVGDSAFATNELLGIESADNDRLLANGYADNERVAFVSSDPEPPLSGLHSTVREAAAGAPEFPIP